MCRHLEARRARNGGQPGQDATPDVGDSLNDLEESLKLSMNLLLLAENQWEDCGHSGRIPLQGILRECARKIFTEATHRRKELEADGRVRFGAVVLEESADLEGPGLSSESPWDRQPLLALEAKEFATRIASETMLAGDSLNTDPPTSGGLGQLCASLLARPAPGGSRWSPARSRQGGA